MSDAFAVPGAGADLASALLALAQRLIAGAGTLAGPRVEISRGDAFTVEDAVAVALYVPHISRDWLGGDPAQFRATVELLVVGVVFAPTTAILQSSLDTLRVQVENALLAAEEFWTFPPLETIRRVETDMHFPADGSPRQARFVMTLHVECTDEFHPTPAGPVLSGATIPSTL